VAPGGRCALRATLPAAPAPGRYQLKLDLVVEGVTWFEPQGSRAKALPFPASDVR